MQESHIEKTQNLITKFVRKQSEFRFEQESYQTKIDDLQKMYQKTKVDIDEFMKAETEYREELTKKMKNSHTELRLIMQEVGHR